MSEISKGKYLLTAIPDKEWNWTRFSVENLSNGSDDDIFYFISAIGQAVGFFDIRWKSAKKKEREDMLGWIDSVLIHVFSAMCKTENEDRKKLYSAFVTLLMNYIECFRMCHKIPSSNVVVRIWAESLKTTKKES
jgi:hypothetical protein